MPWIASLVASLISALGPFIKDIFLKILVALGVSLITHEGIDIVVENLFSKANEYLGEMDSEFIGLFLLSGIGHAINTVIGAANFVISWKITSKTWTFLASKKG
ncbi:DUF2523 domain-containing protein [Neisseria perflava]|uniref:DUF2523 domain-containing protein n=1 Tax=Neisseria perflava TaxID=33053 RepID=UPI00209E6F9B|nr:DUF2523 domain-containing protein [Neisseria perflava]MCP1659531.1 hypothetical protein [Neisseria perflava]MCP1773137.1 hypothetical protein [Neisseria perflava]